MENQIEQIKKWLGTGSINFFGRPFAGKDTQGEIFAEMLDGVLVAGGDILRHYHDQALMKKLSSTGELFPTEIYLKIVLPFLQQNELKEKPLMLSSVGRMKGEENVIVEATAQSGHALKAVVLLELSEEQVWQRYEEAKIAHDRGERDDDHRETLKTRLKEFDQKTEPVIDFYRQKNLLVEIDGTLSREQVTLEIINQLTKRIT